MGVHVQPERVFTLNRNRCSGWAGIRIDLAYNAAHGLALAALRASGYRSDKRYLVFQCLVHTTNLSKGQVRIFSLCHDRRNRAEYEGHLDVDERLLEELIAET